MKSTTTFFGSILAMALLAFTVLFEPSANAQIYVPVPVPFQGGATNAALSNLTNGLTLWTTNVWTTQTNIWNGTTNIITGNFTNISAAVTPSVPIDVPSYQYLVGTGSGQPVGLGLYLPTKMVITSGNAFSTTNGTATYGFNFRGGSFTNNVDYPATAQWTTTYPLQFTVSSVPTNAQVTYVFINATNLIGVRQLRWDYFAATCTNNNAVVPGPITIDYPR